MEEKLRNVIQIILDAYDIGFVNFEIKSKIDALGSIENIRIILHSDNNMIVLEIQDVILLIKIEHTTTIDDKLKDFLEHNINRFKQYHGDDLKLYLRKSKIKKIKNNLVD